MGLFSWLRGKRKPSAMFVTDMTLDGVPGRNALVFSNLEEMMRMAEQMNKLEESGLDRPILYEFQHVVLRDAAFQNHPELLRELDGDPSPIPLLHFQSKARVHLVMSGQDDPNEDDFDADAELFSAVRVQTRKGKGHTILVVTMPEPAAAPEAHFAAIAFKDSEPRKPMVASASTRYFTLEKSMYPDVTMLCEWSREGSHLNHGEGPPPKEKQFFVAVLNKFTA